MLAVPALLLLLLLRLLWLSVLRMMLPAIPLREGVVAVDAAMLRRRAEPQRGLRGRVTRFV